MSIFFFQKEHMPRFFHTKTSVYWLLNIILIFVKLLFKYRSFARIFPNDRHIQSIDQTFSATIGRQRIKCVNPWEDWSPTLGDDCNPINPPVFCPGTWGPWRRIRGCCVPPASPQGEPAWSQGPDCSHPAPSADQTPPPAPTTSPQHLKPHNMYIISLKKTNTTTFTGQHTLQLALGFEA